MVFTPLQTHASFFGDLIGGIGGNALLFVSDFISTILSTVFGLIIWLEAQIIDYLLSPSNFSFTDAPIVKIGWTLMRDLANMFFILILLTIAFATVLRMESYGMKRLLPKLIIAAILINFSLVFAGFVIDFSQVLTTFFIKQAIGDDFGTITLKMASAMNITNFYKPSKEISGLGIIKLTSDAFAASTGIILTLVGLIITVFVFGAMAIFLVLRIINIWWLLIVLPLAVVAAVIPDTSGRFKEWWNNFFKWTFFAPTFAFFIYLSLSIFSAGGELTRDTFGATLPEAWNNAPAGLTVASAPAAIFQFILAITLMFYALIYAQKSGVWGGAQAQKILKGWGDKAQGWAGRQLRRGYVGATKPEAPTPPPTGAGIGARLGYRFRQAGAAVGRGALAVPGIREQQLKYMAQEQAAYQKNYDKYKGLDPSLLKQVSAGLIIDPRERLALDEVEMEKDAKKPGAAKLKEYIEQAKRYRVEGRFIKLAKDKLGQEGWKEVDGFDGATNDELLSQARKISPDLERDLLKQIADKMKKDLDKYSQSIKDDMMKRSQKYGIENDFAKIIPETAAKVLNKPLEQILTKIEEAADIAESELTSRVVLALSPKQLKNIGSKGSDAKRRAAKIAIIQNYRDPNEFSLSDKRTMENVIMEPNKQRREQLRASLPEKLRKMSYQREITITPAWEHNI